MKFLLEKNGPSDLLEILSLIKEYIIQVIELIMVED